MTTWTVTIDLNGEDDPDDRVVEHFDVDQWGYIPTHGPTTHLTVIESNGNHFAYLLDDIHKFQCLKSETIRPC